MKITELESRFLLDSGIEVLINSSEIGDYDRIGIICHPHPLYGGTMDNKVVYSLKRAFNMTGIPSVRFNFRGVGRSIGSFDNGDGETEDLAKVVEYVVSTTKKPQLILAGFSFGCFVLANFLEKSSLPFDLERTILIAPAVNISYYKKFPKLNCNLSKIDIMIPEMDNLVPPSEVIRYYEELSLGEFEARLHKIDGAGHFFDGKLSELTRDLVNIIDR